MPTLAREAWKGLETTVKKARKIAEAGARKIVDERLRVGDAKAPGGLSPDEQKLRVRLRAHGKQLGDKRDDRRGLSTERLVAECAYEHWHRMLFARFLAETELLIEPESGLPISLSDCQELAREQGSDWLELASRYAVRMLPQIFRQDDPVLEIALPPETRSALEDELKKLPGEIFTADDSLGWVYQFWQADEKERVKASEVKIGADELPAVTQLFTEDYMVLFLLHNTLGAWWAGKVFSSRPELASTAASEEELRSACAVGDVDWAYLRFVREGDGPWRPAAGTFEGWPKTAREVTVLDPCMGSGHFLVFALPILVAMRMKEEGLSKAAAVDAVLRDNLHGLEIDLRCTQIAAFNLALAAWKLSGFHELPELQLACSGLTPAASEEEWLNLAEQSGLKMTVLSRDPILNGLRNLHALFSEAPTLGSLIDPNHLSADLITADYETLEPYLVAALKAEHTDHEARERAVAAAGMVKAATFLAAEFTLVITNVPYLGRGEQSELLQKRSAEYSEYGKGDIATTFLERMLRFGRCNRHTVAIVSPHDWWFLQSWPAFRKQLLLSHSWQLAATLGEEAWQTFGMRGPKATLLVLDTEMPAAAHSFGIIDALPLPTIAEKIEALKSKVIAWSTQENQLRNPDQRITTEGFSDNSLLSEEAVGLQGISTADTPKFVMCFWEYNRIPRGWVRFQGSTSETCEYGGREAVLDFDRLESECAELGAAIRGRNGWGKGGVALRQLRTLYATIYTGEAFDTNVAVIVPEDQRQLSAVWAYCSSPEFTVAIRRIDKKKNVTNGTMVKVPFDLTHWQKVATEKYPAGLPEPASDDPTQWLFHGRPEESIQPLQVGVGRLLGYRWPAELDSEMRLSEGARELVRRCDELNPHVDADGIVCLTPIKGEASASDRLMKLLAKAYGTDWSAGKLDTLLRDVGYVGRSLEAWLRDGFFENHCEVFHNCPFVWHIWDGRQDGFHAFVNYHRLAAPEGEGRRTLEKLIYTYLGDWIDAQQRQQQNAVDGADARLAAAVHLKAELEKILHGEPPYDLFVRWRPLHEQPIGWEPDINDGVRLNIRPFMTARPLGARAKNACILRVTPKSIKWDGDRGKEPHREKADFPWFWSWDEQTQDFAGGATFDGKRWNGLHYTTAFKQAARDRHRAAAKKGGQP